MKLGRRGKIRREIPGALAGGLASYGRTTFARGGKARGYVGRLLKGAKSAELPVVQATIGC